MRSLALIGLLAVVTVGVSGYYVGRLQGRNEAVQEATLRVQVQSGFATDQTFQILVNNKAKQSLTVPAGQTLSVDIAVSFAPGDGANFNVEALAATGQHDGRSVLVNAPGVYVVSLSVP